MNEHDDNVIQRAEIYNVTYNGLRDSLVSTNKIRSGDYQSIWTYEKRQWVTMVDGEKIKVRFNDRFQRVQNYRFLLFLYKICFRFLQRINKSI